MDDTVDFEEIGLATSGAVGSDLANMINEAAIAAVKAGRSMYHRKIYLRRLKLSSLVKRRKTGYSARKRSRQLLTTR